MKFLRYTFISSAFFIAMLSCKKILNPDVIQLPTSENAFKTSADINKGIAAAYAILRNVVPDKGFLFGDVRANAFSSYSDNVNVQAETGIPRNDKAYLLNNGGGDWSGFYRTIAQCNLVLESIPAINDYDPALKERHIGEAHFLRALSYFYLTRFWGDVPVNLKSIDVGIIPRQPKEEVFKLIQSDLDIASINLALSYGDGDRAVRATKGAAWAIKAHVMGWLHNYAACEKLCDSVISSNQYQMITDSAQLLKIFVGKSIEGIFEFNFDVAQNEKQMLRIFDRTMDAPYYPHPGSIGRKLVMAPTAAQRNEMFPPGQRDIRLFNWFVQSTYLDAAVENPPYLGKYRTLAAGLDTSSKNINESNYIITRLPDIILLRAEALARPEIGRSAEAANLLNMVRARAKAPLYTGGGNLSDTILLERKKELLGEGQYYFDLVRTGTLVKNSRVSQADFDAGRWLMPINQSIITQSNFAITQTPGWE